MLRVRAAWCQKVGVFDDVYLGLYVCTGKGVGAYVLARLSSLHSVRASLFFVKFFFSIPDDLGIPNGKCAS